MKSDGPNKKKCSKILLGNVCIIPTWAPARSLCTYCSKCRRCLARRGGVNHSICKCCGVEWNTPTVMMSWSYFDWKWNFRLQDWSVTNLQWFFHFTQQQNFSDQTESVMYVSCTLGKVHVEFGINLLNTVSTYELNVLCVIQMQLDEIHLDPWHASDTRKSKPCGHAKLKIWKSSFSAFNIFIFL